jgi:hypothetical protein
MVGRPLAVIAALAALGCWGGVCSAMPSVLGPSGVVVVPDASAVERATVEGFMRRVGGASEWWSVGANLGLAEGVEVGLVRLDSEDAPADTIANVKVVFKPTQRGDLPVALGVWDLTNEISRSYYAVASIGPLYDVEKCKARSKHQGEQSEEEKLESLAWKYFTPSVISVGFGNGEQGGRLDGAFVGLNLGVLALDWSAHDFNAAMRLGAGSGLEWGWVDGDFFLGVWGRRKF